MKIPDSYYAHKTNEWYKPIPSLFASAQEVGVNMSSKQICYRDKISAKLIEALEALVEPPC